MAIIPPERARVGSNGARVAVSVPIDGRDRTLLLDPADAMRIGCQLATAAMPRINHAFVGAEIILDMALRPFDAHGNAQLLLVGREVGPVVFHLDGNQVAALAALAQGALELGATSGTS